MAPVAFDLEVLAGDAGGDEVANLLGRGVGHGVNDCTGASHAMPLELPLFQLGEEAMSTGQIVGWAVAAMVVLWASAGYNRLVRRRNEIGNAFSQIDVQLKRRYDLIPNLVETARKYVQHERDTLEAVSAARNQARAAVDAARSAPTDGTRIGALAGAESTLAGAMGRLMAVVEAYPALKADQTLRELNEELTHTENRVAFARQAFNDCVLDYNNAAQQAPANFIAALFGFKPAQALQSTTSDEERQAVRVKL
jgi:LemA protein